MSSITDLNELLLHIMVNPDDGNELMREAQEYLREHKIQELFEVIMIEGFVHFTCSK